MTVFPRAAERALPLLAALCIGSGCAALMYQVIWFELLGLVIGTSSISLGVLLATFMGGMCAGSLGAARLISPRRHPLKVFACLELGIGFAALVVLAAMPTVGTLYAALAPAGSSGLGSLTLRATIAAICMLPPTVLMGATLPIISRALRADTNGAAGIGLLYAANLFGAVAGSLLAGFWLLRFYDVTVATIAATALNGCVAVAALVLVARWPRTMPSDAASARQEAPAITAGARSQWRIHLAIALSGLTALSA